MRIVLQRVSRASVHVEDKLINAIESGYVLFLGFEHADEEMTVRKMADKLLGLRIWEDDEGKINSSLEKNQQEILAISQFTLYANIKKGKRPSFTDAMEKAAANALYEYFCAYCRELGYRVKPGVFNAHMMISLINDGPVTLILDSKDL